jgi:hypothetical protein
MTRVAIACLLSGCLTLFAWGQDLHPLLMKPGQQGPVTPLPPSNSVSHMVSQGLTLWTGTGKGLARTSDAGRSWESFGSDPAFARPGIFAVAVKGDTVFCSTGYSQEIDDQSVQTGTGYTYSVDGGTTWFSRPQTLDGQDDTLVVYGINNVLFLPVTVDEQNVTFDVALSDSFVWITSWSSGLRRSSNLGETWERIVLPADNLNSISPSDSLGDYYVDPRQNNNFLLFSVYVQDDTTVWAGSAGGINKSTDGGRSWVKFNTLNQAAPLLGNWVIAIDGQKFGSTNRIWTTNWPADLGPVERYGVSYSDDGGRIWHNLLPGVKAYDFAFKDSIAYVATDEGIYRTADAGLTWTRSGAVVDEETGQIIASRSFFSVGVLGDTVFCGGPDGMAKTADNAQTPFGTTWTVLRAYQSVGTGSTTYAYPNPFSPAQEPVRIHYSTGGVAAQVTVEVFDFGMNRVRTVARNAARTGSEEHDELWDGTDDAGRKVANGVYLYRVVVNDGDPAWGKILVLQ